VTLVLIAAAHVGSRLLGVRQVRLPIARVPPSQRRIRLRRRSKCEHNSLLDHGHLDSIGSTTSTAGERRLAARRLTVSDSVFASSALPGTSDERETLSRHSSSGRSDLDTQCCALPQDLDVTCATGQRWQEE
jgi:hypothetical protein